MDRKIYNICIHCSATSQKTRVETIVKNWKKMGWKNPGYHYIYKANGEEVQLLPDKEVANGVKGHNQNTIHMAYIGGINPETGRAKDTRTKEQKDAMIKRLKLLAKLYPNAKVCGHRDFSPDLNGNGYIEPHEYIKQCPSFNVKNWVSSYKLGDELANMLR